MMPDPMPGGGAGGGPGGGGGGRFAYLLDALRHRPLGRRILSVIAALLFLAGTGMFAYPFVTDVYAEQVVQERLETEYETPEFVERYITRTVQVGDPLTRIVVPAIGVSAVVVEGTSSAALRAGAGHYPTTPLPGEAGNVAIAGHRTTYGKPFNRLDEVPLGSEVRLETPIGTHVYRVIGPPAGATSVCANRACWITAPNDWSVVGPTDRPMLTLTTCHPKGSAAQRLILRAELVESLPVQR